MRDFVTKAFEALSWIIFALLVLGFAIVGAQGSPDNQAVGLLIGLIAGLVTATVLFGIIFAILDMKDSLDKIVVLLEKQK